MSEVGQFTGLPLDLPPGKHPFDWYIQSLIGIIGERKTAMYLAVRWEPLARFDPDVTTVRALPDYL